MAAKRSVFFEARALTGPNLFWFKTSNQWVCAAMGEVVNSMRSDDQHYRH